MSKLFERVEITILKESHFPASHPWTSIVLVDGVRHGHSIGSHSPQGAYNHALTEVFVATGLSDDEGEQ